ncbi:MAG: response regulator, partial [Acidimicrobiia bacterium]
TTALEYLEKQDWDAVLLDMQLPGMDGLEVARQYRSQPGVHAPLIAMTASAMEGDRDACMAAGMSDYLAKPVSLAALRAVLSRWIPEMERGDTPVRSQSLALEAITDELGADRKTVHDMVQVFLNEASRRQDAIASAVDTDAFVSAVHVLGSAAAALSLTGLFTACRAAEQAARQGASFDRMTHVEAISAAVNRSQEQLEAWLLAEQTR